MKTIFITSDKKEQLLENWVLGRKGGLGVLHFMLDHTNEDYQCVLTERQISEKMYLAQGPVNQALIELQRIGIFDHKLKLNPEWFDFKTKEIIINEFEGTELSIATDHLVEKKPDPYSMRGLSYDERVEIERVHQELKDSGRLGKPATRKDLNFLGPPPKRKRKPKNKDK